MSFDSRWMSLAPLHVERGRMKKIGDNSLYEPSMVKAMACERPVIPTTFDFLSFMAMNNAWMQLYEGMLSYRRDHRFPIYLKNDLSNG